jgi:hypothetical protein
MPIQKYEFAQLTYIVKNMFPPEPCTAGILCHFNLSTFTNAFNLSSGVISGNSYAIKRLKNFGRKDKIGYGADGDFDPSSPSNYLYYNEDLDE